ncbi:hypothetical protein LTR84_005845 [Exophiala bonariae]|uniref:Uncharacterized protein n=1 Tax=Exophiala bonariae TaxID=1690606 RepID=A0AAV9N255_9EURO|nr:hypothetical protein LTR84_005845 [Exophiala bonariae]
MLSSHFKADEHSAIVLKILPLKQFSIGYHTEGRLLQYLCIIDQRTMIHTGKWAYRKYKNPQARKQELNASAQAKHGEWIVASEDEIFMKAVQNLVDATPITQRSDRTSSHTKIEQHPLIPAQRTLHSFSLAESMLPSPDRGFLRSCEPREAPQVPPSSGQESHLRQQYSPNELSILSPQSSQSAVNEPDEIEVHGKWIWIPDNIPLQKHPGYTPGIPSTPGMNELDLVRVECLAELLCDPRELGTSENDQFRGPVPAELDGTELPFENSEERGPYAVKGK